MLSSHAAVLWAAAASADLASIAVFSAAASAAPFVALHDHSSDGIDLDTDAILANEISAIATTSRCRARMRGRFFSNHKSCYDMTEEDKMGITVDVTVRASVRVLRAV